MTNRQNTFNDTDFIYKGFTGPLFHTVGFGTQLGRQAGIDVRNPGLFPNGTNTEADNPFAPTYFGPINFLHQYPGFFSPGVTTADSNSLYQLNTQSAYARDTIEITRWLQLIAAVRVDRFDETALDLNTKTLRNRVDKLVSPADAVIIKPVENLSIYYSYMVSYLPASGDQFSDSWLRTSAHRDATSWYISPARARSPLDSASMDSWTSPALWSLSSSSQVNRSATPA